MSRWIAAAGLAVVAIIVIALLRSGEDRSSAPPSRPVTAPSPIVRIRDAGVLVKPPVGGLRLEGQVIDELDRPVAGATVRFVNFDRATTSGEDGSFVFENLGADEYRVVAEKGRDTWCELVRTQLTATSEPVILRLQPAATAIVRVIDEAGKPIAGALLYREVSDENGEVRIHGLRPGGNDVLVAYVEASGFESARVKITNLDLASDNIITVKLRRGVTIAGSVVDPNGVPVANAYVSAREGERQVNTESDAAGAWTLTLAAGTFELVADAAAGRSAPIELVTDGVARRDGIVLRLVAVDAAHHVTVPGIVVDGTGKPVAGATVSIWADSFGWGEESDATGRFTVRVPATTSSGRASARKDKLASPETAFDVATRELRLVLAPSSIAGIVVTTRGRPAPGVRVALRSISDDTSTLTDDKGRFELGGLVPGEHALVVGHTDEQYGPLQQGIVASTGARDVRLVVTDIGNITGRVVLDGKPVPYFAAFVHEADPLLDRPVINRAHDGRFTIKGVVAGTWSIVIAGPGFARAIVKAVVTEGDDVDLGDIAVEPGRSVRGRVTDGTTGVANATVEIHESDYTRDPLARAVEGTGTTTTDASGNYRITGLAPSLHGKPRHIVAKHPTRGVSIDRPLAETETEVNLVIARAGGIDGRLEGMDTGVLYARVEDPTFVQGVAPDHTKFRIDNLAPGRYRLRPNGLTAVTAIATVVSGQRTQVALVVPPERIEVSIAGTCSTVTLATADGLDVIADESCTIANVPPGTYRACADGACNTIEVKPAPAKQAFR